MWTDKMSKLNKRKTGGDINKVSGRPSNKEIQKRPSVFERLGTKASDLKSLSVVTGSQGEPFCRNWLQNGTCSYGNSCPYLITHTLISSSKRNAVKESEVKQNCHLPDDRRRSPDINWEVWDQSDLEYEDEKVLEKRLQLLQRELELQMKRDTKKKEVLKPRSSSTSSSSTSSSGSTSTSRSTTETNSSSKHKEEDKKVTKRLINPSPNKEISTKKEMGKTSGSNKGSPSRKSSASNKSSPLSRKIKRKTPTPPRKGPSPKPKMSSSSNSNSSSRKKDSDRDKPTRGDRKRSVSRSRRPPSPRFSKSSRSTIESSRSNPRPRSPERIDKKRDDDKKGKDDFRRDRKSDYRDKRDHDDSRSREKAREAAREKERMEALERCRERQREREQLAKERERKEASNSSSIKRDYDKNKRDRKDRKDIGKDRFEKRPTDDKDKRSRGASRDHDRRERSYDRKGDREKSYDRERARDRALERIMMERKSLEKRPRDDRSTTSRRIDEKGGDRNSRYDSDRLYKNLSPSRDDHLRLSQHYSSDDRRSRRRVGETSRERGGWEGGRYDDASSKSRGDWGREGSTSSRLDYSDRRSDWSRLGGGAEEEGDGDWSYGSKDWRRQNISSQPDDRRSRRDSKEKDHLHKEMSKEKEVSVDSNKRGRESNEPAPETKRIRLEEELSDISDEADEILNREDVEDAYIEDSYIMNEELGTQGEERSIDENDCKSLSLEQRMLESRIGEDEGMDNLDFEEISDEELEEEANKFSKGGSVGDALGVDWASLMADCKPERKTSISTSARDRWSTRSIINRMGLSLNLAGSKMFSELKEKYDFKSENVKNNENGIIYKTVSTRLLTRSNLFNNSGKHKRALSARSDIFIRRQLCNLPVSDLEAHQTIGQCQWVV